MSYIRQWQQTPRTAGFLLGNLPLAIISFAILATLFSAGVGLLIVGVGVVILRFGLATARERGGVWRSWVVRVDGRAIPIPPPPTPGDHPEHSVSAYLQPLTVRSDWRAMLHQALLGFLLTLLTWTVAATWAVFAVVGPLYWALARLIPQQQDAIGFSELVWPQRVGVDIDPLLADSVLYAALGLIFLATLPPVFRGLTTLHWSLARTLLGESESDSLRREVASLESSRGAAAAAENRTLGQLERDLHDGPQQRLVRLQMDLATAERRLADNPDAAAKILGDARSTARDTLDELRALSRGFAPPILGDRGLAAALETLAARGPIPVDLTVTAHGALPPELERNLYFVAAELITNAAKHSGAERITVALDAGPHPSTVSLTVTDQGTGGIVETPGHGIAGLAERLRGIGGTLTVSSPAGGPSTVVAVAPVSLGS